jgi:hypothetical protein
MASSNQGLRDLKALWLTCIAGDQYIVYTSILYRVPIFCMVRTFIKLIWPAWKIVLCWSDTNRNIFSVEFSVPNMTEIWWMALNMKHMLGWTGVSSPLYVHYLHFVQSKQNNMCLISERVYISVCVVSAFFFFSFLLFIYFCSFGKHVKYLTTFIFGCSSRSWFKHKFILQ